MDTFLTIVAVLIFAAPLVLRLILWLYTKYGNTDTIKCKQCKGTMFSNEHFLYLLPLHFDDKYKPSPDYYKENFVQIHSENEIPEYRRACHLYVFQCSECGNKNVSLIDFLRVRDTEVLKEGQVYPYEDFREYLENQTEHCVTDDSRPDTMVVL